METQGHLSQKPHYSFGFSSSSAVSGGFSPSPRCKHRNVLHDLPPTSPIPRFMGCFYRNFALSLIPLLPGANLQFQVNSLLPQQELGCHAVLCIFPWAAGVQMLSPRWINPSQQCVPCSRHGGTEAWARHCFTLTFSQPISSKCAIKLGKIIQHLPFHHMSHSVWPCLLSALGWSPRWSSNHHSLSHTSY